MQQLGGMLPYTPLYDILLKKFAGPIIATSGNVSHSPIVFQDEKAFSELKDIADFILTNNRQITVPQDDSVVKLTPFGQKRIVIRRSRGLAPTFVNPELQWSKTSIFAAGAMLKSTFAFLHAGNTYISQYLWQFGSFRNSGKLPTHVQASFPITRYETRSNPHRPPPSLPFHPIR